MYIYIYIHIYIYIYIHITYNLDSVSPSSFSDGIDTIGEQTSSPVS